MELFVILIKFWNSFIQKRLHFFEIFDFRQAQHCGPQVLVLLKVHFQIQIFFHALLRYIQLISFLRSFFYVFFYLAEFKFEFILHVFSLFFLERGIEVHRNFLLDLRNGCFKLV